MSGQRAVTGRVRLLEPLGAAGGTMHVSVEDVSRADAASTVLAETTIRLDDPVPAGGEIPFTLVVPAVDERASYSVRVHLDTTGSGNVTQGDRLSTEAYPVLTRGHPDAVTVEARTV